MRQHHETDLRFATTARLKLPVTSPPHTRPPPRKVALLTLLSHFFLLFPLGNKTSPRRFRRRRRHKKRRRRKRRENGFLITWVPPLTSLPPCKKGLLWWAEVSLICTREVFLSPEIIWISNMGENRERYEGFFSSNEKENSDQPRGRNCLDGRGRGKIRESSHFLPPFLPPPSLGN